MFLQIKEVCAMLNISRSAFYHFMKNDPNFPRPKKLGNKKQSRVYFVRNEIIAWANNSDQNKETAEK